MDVKKPSRVLAEREDRSIHEVKVREDRELVAARWDLIQGLKEMVREADAAERGLTSLEKRVFDASMNLIDVMDGVMRHRVPYYLHRGRIVPPANDLPILPNEQGNLATFVTPTGEEVRGIPHGISYAVARPSRQAGAIEAGDLRVGRLIRGLVTGDWRNAEAEHRAAGTIDATLGGYLLPWPVSGQVIDLARADSVLMRAGALTLPMESKNLTIARVARAPRPVWASEHDKVSLMDVGFSAVQLVAKALVAIVPISLELAHDAPNAADVIENTLRTALALELDRAGLFGSGAGEEPRGIYYDPGLASVDMGASAGGAITRYGPFVDAIKAVREANGIPTAAIYSPRTEAELANLTDQLDQPLQPPRSVAELKHFVSTQIPNTLTHGSAQNASVAFVGDFRQMVFGLRDQVTVDVSGEAGEAFERRQVLVRVYLRGDIAVVRPSHICAIRGIIPPES